MNAWLRGRCGLRWSCCGGTAYRACGGFPGPRCRLWRRAGCGPPPAAAGFRTAGRRSGRGPALGTAGRLRRRDGSGCARRRWCSSCGGAGGSCTGPRAGSRRYSRPPDRFAWLWVWGVPPRHVLGGHRAGDPWSPGGCVSGSGAPLSLWISDWRDLLDQTGDQQREVLSDLSRPLVKSFCTPCSTSFHSVSLLMSVSGHAAQDTKSQN